MRRPWRILILLLVLVLVAAVTVWERLWVRAWTRPLAVAIYPVAMDAASQGFVAQLRAGDFREIGVFLASESGRWSRGKSVPLPRMVLKPAIRELPPLEQARSGAEAIRLSLRLRWYAFRQTSFWESLGGVRLFVLYHQPRHDETLPHSLGLKKGLLGVVHVFATDEQRAQNNVVIAHELLHTLGATDKYDETGKPIYPVGFADPYAEPRYPQDKAEIMAGRIAVSEHRAEIPRDLGQTVIGYATAAEIGW
ncbi:MAG: hypothetical protein AMJ84_13880 [Acidithiobacillales bacterium SM23_46]|jgi:hypothetical protein|nr:MAG: hypothetical protein AMJ84_13880 [Acidithiobacillales bacterium SM23_46]